MVHRITDIRRTLTKHFSMELFGQFECDTWFCHFAQDTTLRNDVHAFLSVRILPVISVRKPNRRQVT